MSTSGEQNIFMADKVNSDIEFDTATILDNHFVTSRRERVARDISWHVGVCEFVMKKKLQ
jgi:hypothetical protein